MVAPLSDLGPESVPKASLTSRSGVSYRDFRKTLTPRYGAVWAEIAAGWLGLAAVAAAVVWASSLGPLGVLTAVPLGALGFGLGIAYLQLYFHEATHYHLAPSRRLNDLLANVVLGSLIAQEVSMYRRIHMGHHQRLGEADDPEPSYLEPFGPAFVLERVSGVRVLKAVARRLRYLGADASPARSSGGGRGLLGMLAVGLLLHLSIASAAVAAGSPALAIAWLLGMFSVFGTLSATRQALEHRPVDGRAGRFTRLFGDGLFDRIYGAAGFNRHLLHHWDAGVPSTRLRELETFLLDTDLGPGLDAARTTYRRAFFDLIRG